MFKSTAVVTIAAALFASSNAAGQSAVEQKPHWQFIVNSGTIVPTGAQRDVMKRGSTTTAQLSYVVKQALAITGSFGWARSRDVATVGDPKLDIFTYDVGVEARAHGMSSNGPVSISPFAGIGAGGRSYNYRNLDVDATHNVAAYASAGTEIGMGSRLKLRLEARDYVTGFKPLIGAGEAVMRNDLSVMGGLRVRVR